MGWEALCTCWLWLLLASPLVVFPSLLRSSGSQSPLTSRSASPGDLVETRISDTCRVGNSGDRVSSPFLNKPSRCCDATQVGEPFL